MIWQRLGSKNPVPNGLTLLVGTIAILQMSNGQTSTRRGLTATDSSRVLRSARSAQTSFESYRRARLPRGEPHGGECDTRIGRYCYWRGDETDEGDAKPPDEMAAIR